ncbi:hypothetical protein F2Q68_00014415 [Brassica cretica]|uniref:Uncharacterized protein n=1 Tax=Brassica cretica TaxID=69181 RepID=A0A8S9HDV0_BRACR|nr:hypothetical protein F2Q68_00014415 [Brassica cretica]
MYQMGGFCEQEETRVRIRVLTRLASLSSPALSQILATPGVHLSLQSAPCSQFQSSGTASVEACSPSPIAALLPPNAALIHIE